MSNLATVVLQLNSKLLSYLLLMPFNVVHRYLKARTRANE